MPNNRMHVRHSDFDCIHAVYAEQGGGSRPHKFDEWGYKPFSLMKVHQRFIDETLWSTQPPLSVFSNNRDRTKMSWLGPIHRHELNGITTIPALSACVAWSLLGNRDTRSGVGTQCSGVYYHVYPPRHNMQMACITSWIHANPYQDVWWE